MVNHRRYIHFVGVYVRDPTNVIFTIPFIAVQDDGKVLGNIFQTPLQEDIRYDMD
jgi:hypothetical protein